MPKGNLYVVSGPSGAGKSTICRLVRKMLGINLATSARDYYFLTKEEFLKKRENGDFLETATVHGNYYGTLKSEVENRMAKGENVILEIDVQGGLQVRDQYPGANLIFFKTPTENDLEARLRGRKTDSEETIQLRLANSIKELEYEKEYDITIINHTVEQACNELKKIIEEKSK